MPAEQILAAAGEVFAEVGFRSASMDMLAERAGATKPTLYTRFGDKAKLYEQCLRHEATVAREYLIAEYWAASDLSGRDKTRADVQALFNYARDRPSGFTLLMSLDSSGTAAAIQNELLVEITAFLAHQIATGAADAGSGSGERARLVAAMTIGSVVHAARWFIASSRTEDAAAIATDFAVAGLRAVLGGAEDSS